MFKREDVLEEYIKKEEVRGHPDWAIIEALERGGVKRDSVEHVARSLIRKKIALKNFVFASELILWLLLAIITSITSRESLFLIVVGFSPILLNYIASFFIVKDMKEKFLIFMTPFIATLIIFVLIYFFARSALEQMDLTSLSVLNISIGLVFNIFIYFTNDYKNTNIFVVPKLETKDDKKKLRKEISSIVKDSYEDIEALRKEFEASRVSQKEIMHELAELKAKEQPEVIEQKMVIAAMKGKRFHRSGCIAVANVDSKEIIHFKDKKEAMKEGYRPCNVCLPED